MNDPGYREEPLSLWQKILNLLGLTRVSPVIIAESVEIIFPQIGGHLRPRACLRPLITLCSLHPLQKRSKR